MTQRTFRLYPEERHWWSMNDYAAVMDTMEALKPARVLEFGPGSSTLALIEGGAERIDTCEDDPDWAQTYEERLQAAYPAIVHVRRYSFADPLSIPSIDGERYDLALIDGPLGTDNRPAVVRYCLDRCAAVLVPTEDKTPGFRSGLIALANELGWSLDIRETGPLSGGFALFTKPDKAEAEPVGSMVVDAPMPLIETPELRRLSRRQRRAGRVQG